MSYLEITTSNVHVDLDKNINHTVNADEDGKYFKTKILEYKIKKQYKRF